MVSLFKLNVRYPIFDPKIMIVWGIYDIRRKKVSAILRHSFVSRFEKKKHFLKILPSFIVGAWIRCLKSR
jgi:hypothetical protein